eukprot:539117-Amphidinium_carterae.1
MESRCMEIENQIQQAKEEKEGMIGELRSCVNVCVQEVGACPRHLPSHTEARRFAHHAPVL